mgnify:CR=1 FL=1
MVGKICAPVKSLHDMQMLSMADEFYCGVEDINSDLLFGKENEYNRRSYYGKGNVNSIDELKKMCEFATNIGKKIVVTFNNYSYPDDQLDYIKMKISDYKRIGIYGVIVADIRLVSFCKSINLYVIISTTANVYNYYSMKFFSEQGANRFVIPRELTLDELLILQNHSKEFEKEMFTLNGICINGESNCFVAHWCPGGALCSILSADFSDKAYLSKTKGMIRKQPCNVCSLWDAVNSGIQFFKVVGRVRTAENLRDQITVLRENLLLAESSKTKEEYLQKVQRPDACCSMDVHCYNR